MKTALLSPGRGSRYVGMGKFLSEAFPEVQGLCQTDIGPGLLQSSRMAHTFEMPERTIQEVSVGDPTISWLSCATASPSKSVLDRRWIHTAIRCEAAEMRRREGTLR